MAQMYFVCCFCIYFTQRKQHNLAFIAQVVAHNFTIKHKLGILSQIQEVI